MPSDSSSAGAKSRSSRGGSSKAASASESKTAAAIRAEDWDKFVVDSINSHTGWLAKPILALSSGTGSSPMQIAIVLASVLLAVLLVAPANWVPHISAPLVIMIPVQNTLMSMSVETKKKSRGDAVDSVQWAGYWMVWCVLGWMGNWVGVFRPGWRGVLEVWRVAALVVAGGPWFGRAGLRPAGPSAELQAAEKRKAAEAERAGKEEAKRKENADRAKKDEKAKEAKAREKEKEKARTAREKTKEKERKG